MSRTPVVARESSLSPTVLVIEHEADAPIARFGPWLTDAGVRLDVRRPWTGDQLPSDLRADGLVVLGGAMSAGDDDAVPWLATTRSLLAQAVVGEVPTFAICLGAQLLAVATGGRVEVGVVGPELGICPIELTAESASDRLFSSLRPPVLAPQWHYDAIAALPPDTVLLATADRYEVQAFRIGTAAWGVQFHPEIDGAVMAAWVANEHSDDFSPEVLSHLAEEVEAAQPSLTASWRGVAERFAKLVGAHARSNPLP